MGTLKQRVALVTGAGRGIGRAIALALAKEGASVALSARTADELQRTTTEIVEGEGTARAFVADLAHRGVARQLVEEVRRTLGPIDILVNNAGVGSSSDPRPVVDFREDFWDLTMELNLTAPFLLCQAVLPGMLDRRWGRIINVASINGKIGALHGCAYAASKHGLLGLTRTLAMEVAAHGVTVNALCPGPVRTVMNDRRIAYDAQRRGVTVTEVESGITPIGRRLEPEEIAPWAVYLARDNAAAITGQAFNLDGGVLMTG